MWAPPLSRVPGPRPQAAPPALAQLPWGTVELPGPGPSPRASWPPPWPWPALQRAALTRRLLVPRYGEKGWEGPGWAPREKGPVVEWVYLC